MIGNLVEGNLFSSIFNGTTSSSKIHLILASITATIAATTVRIVTFITTTDVPIRSVLMSQNTASSTVE